MEHYVSTFYKYIIDIKQNASFLTCPRNSGKIPSSWGSPSAPPTLLSTAPDVTPSLIEPNLICFMINFLMLVFPSVGIAFVRCFWRPTLQIQSGCYYLSRGHSPNILVADINRNKTSQPFHIHSIQSPTMIKNELVQVEVPALLGVHHTGCINQQSHDLRLTGPSA